MQKMILVTNNNSTNAQILIKALENGGCNIITASDNEDTTINKCVEFHPNFIIVDIDMPIKDGYSLSKELKKSTDTKDIRVIIIKSKNNPLDKTWAMLKGSDFYFATINPFKEDTLIAAIISINWFNIQPCFIYYSQKHFKT